MGKESILQLRTDKSLDLFHLRAYSGIVGKIALQFVAKLRL